MNFYRKLSLLVLLVIFPLVAFSSKIVPLTKLIKPDSIVIDNQQIYITDAENVYIYSKDFTLKKKFGKSGEGPGEFKINPAGVIKLQIYVQPDHLVINNLGRVSFFTKDGIFKNQINVTSGNNFQPVGKGFVGYTGTKRIQNTLYLSINTYNSNFDKIKEIYSREYYVQTHRDFNLIKLGCGNKGRAYYISYDNKIFIEGENDVIHVFDENGNKEYDIHLDYEKLKISKSHKEEILKDIYVLYTGPTMRTLIKEKGKFPTYFPARFFDIADGKIYIPTYKKEAGKNEFVIYDIKGKLLKKVFLPFKDQTLLLPYPYSINDNTFYQLVDNEDTENWEVHITGIE
jgi:hypothetical protein